MSIMPTHTRVQKIRLAILIVIAAGLFVYATPTLAKFTLSNVFDQLDLLVDVRHEIVEHYVEQPDEKALVEGAVRGMIETLNDPYTSYLAPEDLDDFDKAVRGTFSGIGAEIDIHNDYLRIVTPLEGTPAWEAGILPGDVVLEIEGDSTKGMSINDAVSKLTGESGTDVTVLVRHPSGDEETITITRARITVPTIKGLRRNGEQEWDYMLDDNRGIGYIRIAQFTEQTAADLRDAIERLKSDGLEALILDVRFNPGGLLPSAVQVSDMFLNQGERIVSVKGRTVPEQVFDASRKTVLGDAPMVVLANEASASASEIVTGALSDNDRAIFVGTRTFGKGSVQQVRMLDSGLGAIKITNAYYYLPSGRKIHRVEDAETWGVDPDEGFFVSMNADEVRAMLDARREALLNPKDLREATVTAEFIEQRMKDLQLAAAYRAVRAKVEQGRWEKTGESGVEALARLRERERLIQQQQMLEERILEIDDLIGDLSEGENIDVTAATLDEPARKFRAKIQAMINRTQGVLELIDADAAEARELTERLNEWRTFLEQLKTMESAPLLASDTAKAPRESSAEDADESVSSESASREQAGTDASADPEPGAARDAEPGARDGGGEGVKTDAEPEAKSELESQTEADANAESEPR